jgi:hypothetical protein
MKRFDRDSVSEMEGRELTKKTEGMSLWGQISPRVLTAWSELCMRGVEVSCREETDRRERGYTYFCVEKEKLKGY